MGLIDEALATERAAHPEVSQHPEQSGESPAHSACAAPRPITVPLLAEQVEWVVNDIAELGVKIGDQFFWLYKGDSLVYGEHEDSQQENGVCLHDDGKQMHWRHVFKREFGECCHPVNYQDPGKWGTVSLQDSDEWNLLPAAPQAQDNVGAGSDATPQAECKTAGAAPIYMPEEVPKEVFDAMRAAAPRDGLWNMGGVYRACRNALKEMQERKS